MDIAKHSTDYDYRMILIPSSLNIQSTLSSKLVLPGPFMQLFAMDMTKSFRGYKSY